MRRLGFSGIRIAELRRLLRSRGLTGSNEIVDEAMQGYGVNPLLASKVQAGIAFKLTLAERIDLKIRTIDPYDCSAEEKTAAYRERKLKRDRDRSRQARVDNRSRRQAAEGLDVRAEAVWMLLHSNRFCSIADLVTALAEHEAFQAPSGLRLPPDSLRKAVRRSVLELDDGGKVEVRRDRGTYRQALFRVRRARVVIPLRA